jgi:RNA polymerase sigma factor (sigma-70 family)
MDDSELLRTYLDDRSQQAFTQLVERYVGIVYSTALRRCSGSPEQAKDVTQIVFIRLAQKARSLLRHPTLAGWLHRSAALEAASTQRAEMRRQQRETAAASHPDWSGAGSDVVEWEQLSPLLDEALLELSEHDREAIVLRFFANKPFAAMGAQLGLAENAARMRVDRALIRLRARLARHGITSTAAALGLVLANNAAGAAPIGLAATVSSAVATGVTGGSAGVTGALGLLLMTKIQLGVFVAVLAVLFSGVAWEQRATAKATQRLVDEEHRAGALKRTLADSVAALASAETSQASPVAHPLTPDDQERKRVGLLIFRKLQDT